MMSIILQPGRPRIMLKSLHPLQSHPSNGDGFTESPGIAVGRGAWLFAGSDRVGARGGNRRRSMRLPY
jgi:hypothetical protein